MGIVIEVANVQAVVHAVVEAISNPILQIIVVSDPEEIEAIQQTVQKVVQVFIETNKVVYTLLETIEVVQSIDLDLTSSRMVNVKDQKNIDVVTDTNFLYYTIFVPNVEEIVEAD